MTASISISENRLLNNESPNQREIFDLVNSFSQVKEIWLADNNLTSIPSNAFMKYQPSVTWLSLIDNQINQIGDEPFKQLPNLKYLLLDGNKFEFIPSKAFVMKPTTIQLNESFRLYLRENGLTQDSFDKYSLAKIRRKVLLDVARNNITFLPKSVFGPLFRRQGSAVIIRDNPLKCDCKFKWLFDRNLLYNSSDNNKPYFVRGMQCANDKNQFHIKMSELYESNFTGCTEVEEELEPDYNDDQYQNEFNGKFNVHQFNVILNVFIILIVILI